VQLDRPDPALKVMTRRLKDANVYLFFNEGAKEMQHAVTLNARGQMVQVWDPQSGTVTSDAASAVKGGLMVQVALKPYETQLLMVR
jgi:hypothetical protein